MENINPMENNMPSIEPVKDGGQKKDFSLPLMVLAAAVLALIIWWVARAPAEEVVVATPTPTSTPVVKDEIQMEVEAMDLGDIDSEFKEIDQDLNTL